MEANKNFGAKLKELRREKHLSIEKVAADIGVTVRTMRAYERGDNSPKDDTKAKLCNYYNVGVTEIFFTMLGQ